MTLPEQVGWTRRPPDILSNLNYGVILRYQSNQETRAEAAIAGLSFPILILGMHKILTTVFFALRLETQQLQNSIQKGNEK